MATWWSLWTASAWLPSARLATPSAGRCPARRTCSHRCGAGHTLTLATMQETRVIAQRQHGFQCVENTALGALVFCALPAFSARTAPAPPHLQDWDARLLRHELCEEVTVVVQAPVQSHLAPVPPLPGSSASRWGPALAGTADTPHLAASRGAAAPAVNAELRTPLEYTLGPQPPAASARVAGDDLPAQQQAQAALGAPSVTLRVADAARTSDAASIVRQSCMVDSEHSDVPSLRPSAAGTAIRAARSPLEGHRSCVQVQRRVILRGLRVKVRAGFITSRESPVGA